MALMANSCPRKMPQKIRPQIFPMTIAYLAFVKRLADLDEDHEAHRRQQHGRCRGNVRPWNPEKTSPQVTSAPTASASVIPAGSARSMTLVMKRPRIRSRFGSIASRNPGTPMVNMLISEIWDGSSG